MLSRIEVWFRWARRSLSRSHWLARLLQLPVSTGSGVRPGLVMLQIDGLSQPELQRALARGEMPFLRRLLKKEHYTLHAHYSGLPATTPAVQAELFYGVKTAVPDDCRVGPQFRVVAGPHSLALLQSLFR